MPRVMKTVVPRIRKSIAERGVLVSMGRSVLLPMHLWQEYRKAKKTSAVVPRSDFDVQYGVDTDGDINGWTHLSDLNIPSSNWIYGRDYAPIEPERFRAIFTRLNIGFQDFVFVDFGSGKGRALLLASEFPFKRVVGLEFSPELHQIAQANIRLYASQRKSGPVESICADFLEFQIPADPAVFFFFDPCEHRVLKKLLEGIRESLLAAARVAYLVYIAPTESKKALFDSTEWLAPVAESAERNYFVYRTR
jgi:SAM-dependent methyltransferase